MGFELAATLTTPLSAVAAGGVLDALAGDLRWRVVHRDAAATLGLRWTEDREATPGWPASAEIALEPARVTLIVHAGTGRQREALVAALEQALRDHGVDCTLEEL